jgi:hypothetical protein
MMPDTMLLDMVVCDTLIRDMATSKWTIVGAHDRIVGTQFPLGVQSMQVYIRIANAPKQGVFGLTVAAPSGVVVQSRQFGFEGIDPRMPFEVGCYLPPVLFSQPGRYAVACMVDDEVLGERGFHAEKVVVRSEG